MCVRVRLPVRACVRVYDVCIYLACFVPGCIFAVSLLIRVRLFVLGRRLNCAALVFGGVCVSVNNMRVRAHLIQPGLLTENV